MAKDLLLKVRLHLLSEPVLKDLCSKFHVVTRNSSAFQNSQECVSLIKDILQTKKKLNQPKQFSSSMTRYCSQNKFDLMLFGKNDNNDRQYLDSIYAKRHNIIQVDGENLEHIDCFSRSFNYNRIWAVTLNCEIYLLAANTCSSTMTVHKYCPAKNRWSKISVIKSFNRKFIGPCSFMDKILITGGVDDDDNNNNVDDDDAISSCVAFNTINREIRSIQKMKQARMMHACTVFEGKVVASGGGPNRYDRTVFSTVEKYDHAANTWSNMPKMVCGRKSHSIVAVKNKLFVFGGLSNTAEVFDSSSNKFSTIKSSALPIGDYDVQDTVAIGRKIIIFRFWTTKLLIFDLDKYKWSEELFEFTKKTKNLNWCLCVKIPKL